MWEARERGVIFDLGHGMGGFGFASTRPMLEAGFFPDVISSDVHILCEHGPAFDLLHTMSKLVCLGMPLVEVIRAATARPAEALRRPDLGTLAVGAAGDATILNQAEGAFDYVDVMGERLQGTSGSRSRRSCSAAGPGPATTPPAEPMSRIYKGLYVYAWDLADEGLETVLGRIRPTGINTLTLAASYHAGKFLRPHGVGGKVYFPVDGTVYFQARPERYGHIRPLVNPLVAEFDAFARLEQEAPDLERVAWVVCCHNTPLGQQYPEFTSRNAFGDPYPYSLCPAHPAVRDYVVNLVADLARPARPCGRRAGDAGLAALRPRLPPRVRARAARSLRQVAARAVLRRRHAQRARAADIDADRLQARTGAARALARRRPRGARGARDRMVARRGGGRSRVRGLSPLALPRGRGLGRRRQGRGAGADQARGDPDRAAPGRLPLARGQRFRAAGRGRRCARGAALPAERRGSVLSAWDARRRAGDAADLHFILRPSFPDLANGAETAAAVRRLQPLRPAGIAFYNYGHLRLASPRPTSRPPSPRWDDRNRDHEA